MTHAPWLRFLAVAALGCDTTIHQGLTAAADAPPSAPCLEASAHSDFAWIRDDVFAVSCSAFASCHQGGNPPAQLDLEPARAYDDLVGVAATTIPGWGLRVAPGDPEHSYLLVKLGAVAGPLGAAGTTMPLGSPLLCAEIRDAIRRWIAAGAPPQAPDAGAADAPPPDAGVPD